MPKKIKLLVEGPLPYSDGVYFLGDVFEVGDGAADDYVARGIAEVVEGDEVGAEPGGEVAPGFAEAVAAAKPESDSFELAFGSAEGGSDTPLAGPGEV